MHTYQINGFLDHRGTRRDKNVGYCRSSIN